MTDINIFNNLPSPIVNDRYMKICRTCSLEYQESTSLFKLTKILDEEIQVSNMLVTCASVKVEQEDGLPMFICHGCLHELISAYSFIQKCKKVDFYLRKCLRKSDDKNENVCVDARFNDIQETDGVTSEENVLNVGKEGYNLCTHEDKTNELQEDISHDMNLNHLKARSVCKEIKKRKRKCIYGNDNITAVPKSQCDDVLKSTFDINIERQVSGDTNDSEANKVSRKRNLKRTYKCRFLTCTKTFTNWSECKEHQKNHIKNHYVCRICKKVFTCTKGYNLHKKAHLGTSTSYTCDICGKKLETRSSLYVHKRRHNKQYSAICSECGKGFMSPCELKKHFSLIHEKKKPCQCEICGKKLCSLKSLKYHKQSIHVDSKPFQCSLCPKTFLLQTQFDVHMKRHNKEYSHNCDECEEKFYNQKELDIHKLKHSGERPFKCPKCPKSYGRKDILQKHKKIHSGTNTKHTCDICGKKLETQSSLYVHKRRHNKQYSAICSECGKGFITPCELKKHFSLVHENKKPCQCEICGKKLGSLKSLRYHKSSIHLQDRSFVCTLCPKKFLLQSQLDVHLKRHNKEYSHSCDECDKKFFSQKELDNHKLKHTGERPFQCPKCPKNYRQRCILQKHIKMHGKTIFECSVCFIPFTSPLLYDKHLLTHKKKEVIDSTDAEDISEAKSEIQQKLLETI